MKKPDLSRIKDRPDHVPLVWSHGVGVNSTAVACLLVEWGLRPDLVLFADTLGEHPETYDYVPIMDEFLVRHGLPPITRVVKRSKYASLEASCLATDTLPAKAFGGSACSEKWKIEPQRYTCQHWEPARACWKAGGRVIKVIGYDAGDRDCTRYALSMTYLANHPDPRYDYWHPLRDARLTREDCKAVIRNAGLAVPRKSSCWFCPAMTKPEVADLTRDHPELLRRAITMEVNAAQGKHGLRTTRGLGRRFSWLEHVTNLSPSRDQEFRHELEVYHSHVDADRRRSR